ncbi:DUF3231 family protein [Neobacillus drentensis]|uniref:DUF3231 family protein n=1 Tax=Neobacillus drentensis TaxID=220684 RepID=UPI003003A5F3
MEHLANLTSAEIGTLWFSYMGTTMQIGLFKHIIAHLEDEEISQLYKENLLFMEDFAQQISSLMKKEGMKEPVGFTENDVNEQAPKLLTDGLVLYYLQIASKAAMSKDVSLLALTSRKDVKNLLIRHLEQAKQAYLKVDDLLLERGEYIRPPIIPVPLHNEFVTTSQYLGGVIPILDKKRPLNVMEVSHLFLNIKVNMIGTMICTAFTQVANDSEVKKHFETGIRLSKEIVEDLTHLLLESDVPVPAAWDAFVTDSTESPYSDKLMLGFIDQLTAFGFGLYALSATASLRTDIQVKYANISKKVATYLKDGAELMIKNRWLEQPPTYPDRQKLAKK